MRFFALSGYSGLMRGRYAADVSFRVADDSPGTVRLLFPGRALTVREIGALSDLDDITVRIADVTANLAVLGNRLRDELGPSTFP